VNDAGAGTGPGSGVVRPVSVIQASDTRFHYTGDEPPFRDKRDIATAIKALANTALKLAECDKATGK
jgi:hypothetical protein